MDRRTFIGSVLGLIGAPWLAHAQAPRPTDKIGFLSPVPTLNWAKLWYRLVSAGVPPVIPYTCPFGGNTSVPRSPAPVVCMIEVAAWA